MIEIVKFKAEHWDQINGQDATLSLSRMVPAEYAKILEKQPHSYTFFSGDRIVAVGGIVENSPGRGEVWAEFAQTCRKEFLAIHLAAKRFLDICPFERVEATVDVSFAAAHRWIRLLGFELEAPVMRKYSLDGQDYSLYARVR